VHVCHQVYLHARRAKSQDSIKAGQFAEPRMAVAVVVIEFFERGERLVKQVPGFNLVIYT